MLKKAEKLNLANVPTPVVKLKSLSATTGKNIWMKREDLTGIELSGNKVRKLEYLFYEVLDKGHDYVITCGGKQSNHCRAVAATAARLGLKCLLLLQGEDDKLREGNLFLNSLFGAETVFLTKEQFSGIEREMNEAAIKLSSKGYKPYVIPLGGSTALGAMGYVDAYKEITDFEKANAVSFDMIGVTVGSGGTYAGLYAANKMAGKKTDIAGISVLAGADEISGAIAGMCEELGVSAQKKDFNIVDSYIGEGYGIASQAVISFIRQFAQEEGILLDPVYTGKALHGLVTELNIGKYNQYNDILFLHTGGVFGLFAQRDKF